MYNRTMSSSRHNCSVLLLLLLVWKIDAFSSPSPIHNVAQIDDTSTSTRRKLLVGSIQLATTAAAAIIPFSAAARLESVNRPDLLPREPDLKVIQVEKFLTTGQAKRLNELLTALERDTSFRVRVLCQAYPMTPGLAMYVHTRIVWLSRHRLLLMHSVADFYALSLTVT